jgi:hypothetical protein
MQSMTLKSKKLFKILLLFPLWLATVGGLESCQWADPVLKTLKNCTLPTDINTNPDAADPKKYTFSLANATTDVKTVTWKVLSGSTVLVQSTLSAAQSYVYTASTNGSYTVSAEIETVCGEKKTFSKVITIKTCVQPTAIATTSVSNSTYTYSLTTTTPTDVKTVTWKVLNGSTTLVQEQRTDGSSFNYTFTSSGNYTVSADIETICGEKITRTLAATISVSVATQAPSKIWDKTFGGSGSDYPWATVATADGGFVIAGESISNISGEKSENGRGESDYWIIKINANGQKVWDKTFGGSGSDSPSAIVATIDGGFVIGGYSYSNISGDKSENSKGSLDYWIVKLNSNGQKVWDKTIGGNKGDWASDIIVTTDGSIVIGGYSNSNISGDKSENSKGLFDYWIVKLNSNGQKIWDETIGGDVSDILSTIVATNDGGFVLGGGSESNISGDKSENSKGDSDYWVVKLNSNGQKIWDKTFGGSRRDAIANPAALTIIVTTDGGIVIAGFSNSNVSGDKSENSRGDSDYWIVKLNSNGQKIWDKTFGGGDLDIPTTIIATTDGSFVIGGYSYSNISGDKSENSKGSLDYWIVKLNSNGQKIWDKTLGGAGSDNVATIIATTDGSFVIAGGSASNISGDKSENSRGGNDYWVVKVK